MHLTAVDGELGIHVSDVRMFIGAGPAMATLLGTYALTFSMASL